MRSVARQRARLVPRSVIAALLAAPFILGIAWLCPRRYNPQTRLFTLKRDRPMRTIGATVVFGGTAALFIIVLVWEVVRGLQNGLPWHEYPMQGYAIIWIAWLLGMRAALIDQKSAVKV